MGDQGNEKKMSHSCIDMVLSLAWRKAILASRSGVRISEFSHPENSAIQECMRFGLVATGEFRRRTNVFVTKNGMIKVRQWVKTGVDDYGRPIGPEWLGKLKHLYG